MTGWEHMTGWMQRIKLARIRRGGDEQLLSVVGPIADSIDDALICLRADGVIALWNQSVAQLTGYSADEMMGRPFSDVVPLEARSEVAVLLRHTVEGGRVVYWSGQLLSRGKGSFRVSIILNSIKDSRGRVVGAVAVVRDRSRQQSGSPAWHPGRRTAPASADAEELDAAIDELTREEGGLAPQWRKPGRGEAVGGRSGVYPPVSPLNLPEARLPSSSDDLDDGPPLPVAATPTPL